MEPEDRTMAIKLERAQQIQFQISADPMKARVLGDELISKLYEACHANPPRKNNIIAAVNTWLREMIIKFGGQNQWDLAEQFQYLLRRIDSEVGEVPSDYYD